MEDKMKKIVVCLSTSSRVSWLQVWKQMHSWLSLPISTYWWDEKTQREFERRRYSRISCCSEREKTSRVVYLKTKNHWILFYGKLKNWNWTLGRDRPGNSQDALGTKLNSGKKRTIWSYFPKKVNFMSEILARPVWRNSHLRKLHDKYIVSVK